MFLGVCRGFLGKPEIIVNKQAIYQIGSLFFFFRRQSHKQPPQAKTRNGLLQNQLKSISFFSQYSIRLSGEYPFYLSFQGSSGYRFSKYCSHSRDSQPSWNPEKQANPSNAKRIRYKGSEPEPKSISKMAMHSPPIPRERSRNAKYFSYLRYFFLGPYKGFSIQSSCIFEYV